MSLLRLLVSRSDYELTIAHCNHGMRTGSDTDEAFIHEMAANYGLPFQSIRLQLGDKSSESAARAARYEFLETVRQETDSQAIITAHHLDDRVETMVLNERRGAGWLGRAPLGETETIKRPLLGVSKSQILSYARQQRLEWREDPTNADPAYTLRNQVRQELADQDMRTLYRRLQRYDTERKQQENAAQTILDNLITKQDGTLRLDRSLLLLYDVATARDVLYLLLREYCAPWVEVDYDAVVRLEHFYKTATISKQLSLSDRVWARMDRDAMVVIISSELGNA